MIQLRKVLVVDDAPSTRKILSRVLKNQGHSTVEAENGHKAVIEFIQCSRDEPFDAILLDYEVAIYHDVCNNKFLLDACDEWTDCLLYFAEVGIQ